MTGTPFLGYVSLTHAAPGPVAIALFTVMGQAAYTLQAAERCYITNISLSSNDSAGTEIVTVDTGGATPTKLANLYIPTNQYPATFSYPPGSMNGVLGVAPRAGAPAGITLGKTIEIVLIGYISRT